MEKDIKKESNSNKCEKGDLIMDYLDVFLTSLLSSTNPLSTN